MPISFASPDKEVVSIFGLYPRSIDFRSADLHAFLLFATIVFITESNLLSPGFGVSEIAPSKPDWITVRTFEGSLFHTS